jgi:hypothetical protein
VPLEGRQNRVQERVGLSPQIQHLVDRAVKGVALEARDAYGARWIRSRCFSTLDDSGELQIVKADQVEVARSSWRPRFFLGLAIRVMGNAIDNRKCPAAFYLHSTASTTVLKN